MIAVSPKALNSFERSELVKAYKEICEYSNEWIRRQVIDNDRIDILAVILGLSLQPVHIKLLQFQFDHPNNLQLVYRGSGKSTTCTILKAVHLLLKNAELRIAIVSKTSTNAEAFMKEIKGHFETNEKLREVFGVYYDAKSNLKWDTKEIVVVPKKKITKESSITCVGVGGTIVGKHYDVILADDLIDEENARTPAMREKTLTWYYQTLMPTLDPPRADCLHSCEYHRVGTRYHYNDLYGHLIENELANHHQVIRALNDEMQTPWPERHPPEWFMQKRQESGLIIFNAQYQNDTEAMKGEIFEYDNCQQIDPRDYPEGINTFMGIDLAISEKEEADKFAIVVVGNDKPDHEYYLMDYFEGRLRFSEQTTKILEYYYKWNPVRACIETNAYQLAKYQELKQDRPDLRIKPIIQTKDKRTRAWKLSAIFDDKRMFFKKGVQNSIIEQLVLFPSCTHDDLFDALDLAVKASRLRKKRRIDEPGLI